MKLDRPRSLLRCPLGLAVGLIISGWLDGLLPAQPTTARQVGPQAADVSAAARQASVAVDSACVPIERSLPPLGLDIPSERGADWMSQIRAMEARSAALEHELQPDVDVLLKACRMAIEFQELYAEKDFAKVDRLLVLAQQRLSDIAAGQA